LLVEARYFLPLVLKKLGRNKAIHVQQKVSICKRECARLWMELVLCLAIGPTTEPVTNLFSLGANMLPPSLSLVCSFAHVYPGLLSCL
jgi:hypothetical protein